MLIAELKVWPAQRMLQGPKGSASLEPLVMALFLELAARPSSLVSRRELFNRLWGSVSVGDDNLNRLVAALRRTLLQIGVSSVQIETVPSSGYVLRIRGESSSKGSQSEVEQALSEARDSWRLGLPQPDLLRLALLDRARELRPEDARVAGSLALLHRHAAEYADPERTSHHLIACEEAANHALKLDQTQVEAATALVSVAPLYGRWLEGHRRLSEICAEAPGHPVPQEDLSVLEMATGQIAAAKRRRDLLLKADPLCAIYTYKSVYQHWSTGDRAGMDQVADRAMQLWPLHPAVWTVRFWTLAFTDRLQAALEMIEGPCPQAFPEPMLGFLRQVIAAAAGGNRSPNEAATTAAVGFAGRGPAHAITALFALGLLSRLEESYAVAARYYLRDGEAPVPLHPKLDHPSINEQHRRVTQILFTPACAAMRAEPRFADLCRSIGLTTFWEESGITPDYLLG